MRYSCTALVLATTLISQVAAGPVRHAHQHVHEKKDAAVKLEADLEKKDIVYSVDWTSLTIWKTIDYTYSAGQTWGDPTPAAKVDTPAQITAAPVVAATTPPAQPASTPESTPAPSPSPVAAAPVTNAISNAVSEILASTDATKLLSLGFAAIGINAKDSSATAWIGSDGPYTNKFTNTAAEDLILTIWGSDASWVNAHTPLITHSLPSGSSVTISFATGSSGAWSGVYPDTQIINGQVSNTWGEYTFSPEGVVDVSKEVNMNGHSMSIVGPHCTSDMNTCVFECTKSSTSCEFDYALLNCSEQPGAQSGTWGGAASGGCGWLGASSAHLTTTFS